MQIFKVAGMELDDTPACSHFAGLREARATVLALKAIETTDEANGIIRDGLVIEIFSLESRGSGRDRFIRALEGETWWDTRTLVETYYATVVENPEEGAPVVRLVRSLEQEV